jgi:acylglycerol lipase
MAGSVVLSFFHFFVEMVDFCADASGLDSPRGVFYLFLCLGLTPILLPRLLVHWSTRRTAVTTAFLDGVHSFVTRDGVPIHTIHWPPRPHPLLGTVLQARASVLLLPDVLLSRAARFEALAAGLTRAGFAVHAMDPRGCGLSGGDRCYAERWEDWLQDALDWARRTSCGGRVIVVGQGDTLALHVAHALGDAVVAVVLVSPVLRPRAFGGTVSVLARLTPKLPLLAVDPAERLTTNLDHWLHRSGPAGYAGRIRARAYEEVRAMAKRAVKRAKRFHAPLVILQGELDALATVEASQGFLNACGSPYKRLDLLPHAKHDLLGEDPEVAARTREAIIEFCLFSTKALLPTKNRAETQPPEEL